MKIRSIDAMVTRLPITHGQWKDLANTSTHIEYLIVDVTTDSGVHGVGISHTSGAGAKTLASLITDTLAPRLIGMEVSPRAVWHRAWALLHNIGGSGVTTTAYGAVDIALWDIVAKNADKPLAELLGRMHEKIAVYGGGVNLGKSLDELLDEARDWKASGFHGVKVKVGKPDFAEDVERVTKVREVIGQLPMMIDANQRWNPANAAARIKALEPLELTWMEEPLISDDIAGHADLRRRISTPIAAGENLYNIYQFRDYLSAGAMDIVQADIPRVGGITPFLDIAALAQAFNRMVAPHGVAELSVSVLCALPNAFMAEQVEGGSLTALGALLEPLPVVEGYLSPPVRPGHGLVLDREYLDSCRI